MTNSSRIVPAVALVAGIALAATIVVAVGSLEAMSHEKPFGGAGDVAFAEKVWTGMDGYMEWPMSSGVYPGTSPHGAFLRVYYNIVNVDGEPYHVIVKDNYGGEGVTETKVEKDPEKWLAAVTTMVQRETGYDPENNDWFWVKYGPDGTIMENPKGMALAGRVAKGTDSGCIACHANAGGGDYVFTNDH